MKARKVRKRRMKMVKITEEVLVHYNIVNDCYQQDSRVLYTFMFLFFFKKFDSKLSNIEVWFLIKIPSC